MTTLMSRLLSCGLLFTLAQTLSAQTVESERLYLSGHGKDDAVPWKFMCTSGAQSGYWTNLPVPSQWDVLGFGTLNYKKDLTNAWDERGLYEHDFTVPQDWSGRRVFLVFDGVMTDTSAKLNGESVGPMHQGGFYRFKYEVTKLIKPGETNRLEVTVAKHSANDSINNAERLADYWVFGGIYRPVYLEAVPPQFVERVAIDARADGAFAMDVFAGGVTSADREISVEAQITTLEGKAVGKAFSATLPLGVPASAGPDRLKAELRTKIASPLTWSAETPNLYRVEVRLKHGPQVLHQIEQRFGFRTFEVHDGDGLYVNGRRVILKGVNRHSFWPDSGRCLSEAVQRLDIQTMKDANINAVRMSHYPPDAQFLDLCDEKGLYILDELAGWHHFYDNEVGTQLVREMVTRDVNHPCILFWDNGNEGGFNTNLDNVFDDFDPQQRRVLHPWASFSGLCTMHYLAYDKAEIAVNGQSVYFHRNQEVVATNDQTRYIYMPTEFQHGLYDGGAGASLGDYWKMMTAGKLLGGGFIWAFTDDGVKRPDTGKIDTAGNQAPDGIVGPYRQREGSFYTIKEVWSPIVVTPRGRNSFLVENHYSFTDARQCKFTWQLRQFRQPNDDAAGFIVVGEGVAESPAIPPGGKGVLKLDVPKAGERVGALALRVDDPTGRELWTWVWPMANADSYRLLTRSPATKRVESGESADVIELKAGDLTVSISKQTGLLTGAQRGAQHFSLSNGPRPVPGDARLVKLTQTRQGKDEVVEAKFDGDLKSVTWRLHANGWLQCDYTYTATGPHDYYGVAFDYPEEQVKHKKWLGQGPFRVWKNRLEGTTLNVWDNDYNNTITGWRDWVYPEFKGCFADVRWLQLGTTEGPITVVPKRDNLFVQVLTPEFPPTNLVGQTLPSLPRAGLAFLDAIPPVGSKFKVATALGPQGQPALAQGKYLGSVSFYFGLLASPASQASTNSPFARRQPVFKTVKDYPHTGEPPLPPELQPLFDVQMRDPSICLGPDGNYYLTGTTGTNIWVANEGIRVWKSPDLEHWQPLGLVWSIDGDGTWQKKWTAKNGKWRRAVWAPEIHYLKGNFYIAYCITGLGTGLLKSTTGKAEGPYVSVNTPDAPLTRGIDASLFEDDDGKVYFVYGSGYLARLKDDLSGLAEDPVQLRCVPPDTDPEHHHPARPELSSDYNRVGFEGTYLFKANGRYYLSCAERYYERYHCMTAESENLYGPYHARYVSVPEAGHNVFFQDKTGQWWSTIFGNDDDAPFHERPGILRVAFDADGHIRPLVK